jgi:hypothetical protein
MEMKYIDGITFLCGQELSPLNISVLNWYGERVQGLFCKGVRDLAKMTPPKAPPTEFGFGEPGLYGLDTEHHAFRHRNYLRGFRLLEPQVTSILQHLLDPESAGADVGASRCRAFVEALFLASGASKELGNFTLDGILHGVKVESEVFCTTGKDRGSLDLLISWTTADGFPRQLAIENKLGHHITPGQLPRYKQQILKNVGGNADHAAFFVVAPEFAGKNAKAMRRNSNSWKPVTWQGLLRYWELTLVQQSCLDRDEDFPRLRRALWDLGAGVN